MPTSIRRADIEGKWAFYIKVADVLGGIIRTTIKYGSAVAIFYFLSASVQVLAGHHTFADIGIRVLANFSIAQSISYIAGIGGIAYGMRERKLRRDKTDYLAQRNQQLEKQIDQKRSSSRLTGRGTTRTEDRE